MGRAHLIIPILTILLLLATITWACKQPERTVTSNAEALIRERCTKCHTLAPIQSAKKTPEEWEKTVQRMRLKGAKLSDEEAKIVIQYLSQKGGQP